MSYDQDGRNANIEPGSGHMTDKQSSACGWSDR